MAEVEHSHVAEEPRGLNTHVAEESMVEEETDIIEATGAKAITVAPGDVLRLDAIVEAFLFALILVLLLLASFCLRRST